MPNKHKNAKLRTKLLLSGKLNKKKEVQNTLKYLSEKDAIEKEDIDFDFEKQSNDFGKLDDGDDDSNRIKNPKKRKNPINPEQDAKKKKLNKNLEKTKNSKPDDLIPKKSKKNKYFFIAHPEALDKKDEIISIDKKQKFIIDNKKIEKSLEKKEKRQKMVQPKVIEKQSNDEKLWNIQECSSNEEEEKILDIKEKKKKKKSKDFILDITDIDKNFKIKKSIKRLEDGSTVEVYAPEIQQHIEESEEEESDKEDLKMAQLSENEENDQDKNASSDCLFISQAADKLKSSRFRYLNQLLYSQDSSKSFEFFKRYLIKFCS